MKTEIFERIIYISTADKKESTSISMSYKLTFILEHKKTWTETIIFFVYDSNIMLIEIYCRIFILILI